MEEVLDFVVTFSPFIFSGDALPELTKELFIHLRKFIIYTFKPKLAK